MALEAVLLPGDVVPSELLPNVQSKSRALTLGPGLRHIPPDTIAAVVAGQLCVDNRKNAIWIDNDAGRYIPNVGDLVIATIHHSSADLYHCSLSPYTTLAQLPQLAFENATRKTRPILEPGSLVYARVSLASKHMDPELECVQPSTGKSEGLGPLKGGMLFDISLGMARRLMSPKLKEQAGIVVLEQLAEKLRFEIAVGRNGKLWVMSDSINTILAVGRAVRDTDERVLGEEEQKRVVRAALKGL